ncbi:MAG: F0F1 ATP synthase subunit delta [Candidatus Aminicenantes bacterium]
MKIDLFTFIAQIINFLILVILLRQLLYKRIVRAMDQREEKIKARMREAEEKQEKADQEAESFRGKKEKLEKEEQKILNKAEQQADKKKQDLLDKARKEVDENKKKWQESLQRQKESFLTQLKETAGRQIYAAVRKVLNDLADEELEDRIIQYFISRIKKLDKKKKKELQEKLISSSGKVMVISAFEIKKKLRKSLEEAVQEIFDKEVPLEFEQESGLIGGVELHAHDQTIAWSIDSYLSELEERLTQELKENLPKEEEENSQAESENKEKNESKKQE